MMKIVGELHNPEIAYTQHEYDKLFQLCQVLLFNAGVKSMSKAENLRAWLKIKG